MKKLVVTLFIVCPLVISLFVFASPDKEISNIEKRNLKTKSTILLNINDGTFQSDLEKYLSDQFPFREKLVSNQIKAKILFGKKDVNGAYIGKDNRLFEKITNCDIKNESIDKLIRSINSVNKKTYVMLVPPAGVILKDELPKNAPIYDYDKVFNKIDENVNAQLVDLRPVLNESDDYYLTDHHWTSKGALKAYKAFFNKKCNLELETVSTDFKGTLYSKVFISNIPTDSIQIRKNLPTLSVIADGNSIDFFSRDELKTDDKYNVFQGGNHGLVTITNENNKGKKSIIIVKDSFANSFVQFMVDDYYQITMLDPRYSLLTISQAVEQSGADEVLFLQEIK